METWAALTNKTRQEPHHPVSGRCLWWSLSRLHCPTVCPQTVSPTGSLPAVSSLLQESYHTSNKNVTTVCRQPYGHLLLWEGRKVSHETEMVCNISKLVSCEVSHHFLLSNSLHVVAILFSFLYQNLMTEIALFQLSPITQLFMIYADGDSWWSHIKIQHGCWCQTTSVPQNLTLPAMPFHTYRPNTPAIGSTGLVVVLTTANTAANTPARSATVRNSTQLTQSPALMNLLSKSATHSCWEWCDVMSHRESTRTRMTQCCHSLVLLVAPAIFGHTELPIPCSRFSSSCWRASSSVWQDMRHTFSEKRHDTATERIYSFPRLVPAFTHNNQAVGTAATQEQQFKC